MGMSKSYTQEELKRIWEMLEAVRWWRKSHGIRNEEIGAKMGYSKDYVSKLLTCVKQIQRENGAPEYRMHNANVLDYYRACDICEAMETTLWDVQYAFYHRNDSESGAEEPSSNRRKLADGQISGGKDGENGLYPPTQRARLYGAEEKLINNIRHPAFRQWFGTYHAMFSSTSADEKGRFFRGILRIPDTSEDGLCHVTFEFVSNPVKKWVKRYSGLLTLAKNAAYIALEDSLIEGEITYLLFRNQDLKNSVNVSFAIGLALTLSAKMDHRRPCAERMIISRLPLPEDEEEVMRLMKAQLRMNTSEILLSDESYRAFVQEGMESGDPVLRRFAECYHDFSCLPRDSVTVKEYACIPEKWVHTLHAYTESEQYRIVCWLRSYSESKNYTKVGSGSDTRLYNLLKEEGG